MRFLWFAKVYERTCQDCGYSWQVPRSIARHRIRGTSTISFTGTAARGLQYSQGGQHDLANMHESLASRAEMIETYRRCAKCGVDKFTQRPVRA
jgi:predicted nucleic-acid-binding Zn-ribbon protein